MATQTREEADSLTFERTLLTAAQMFADAFVYPFRKDGWMMILAGTLFSLLLNFLMNAPLVGLLVAIFSAGYFGAFYLDIVSTTMAGRDQVPDWPSISSFWDDIFTPFARLFALLVISFLPVIVLAFAIDLETWRLWHQSPLILGSIAWGCLYFPMAVLATQAFGGVGAALPHIVLPGIVRAFPSYLVAVVALVIAYLAGILGQKFASDIPFVGWLLPTAIAIYAMMFQARMIGLIYVDKQERLGWE